MKKLFPIFILMGCAIFFLAGELAFKSKNLSASRLEKSKEKFQLYEKLFKEVAFKVKDRRIKLSDIKSDVVILNFWASWCVPCLKEFPSLSKLVKSTDTKKLTVIGINNDDKKNVEKLIEKLHKKYELDFNSISDKDGTITEKFHIYKIPVSIIYHQGRVFEVSNGEYDFQNDRLAKLLK